VWGAYTTRWPCRARGDRAGNPDNEELYTDVDRFHMQKDKIKLGRDGVGGSSDSDDSVRSDSHPLLPSVSLLCFPPLYECYPHPVLRVKSILLAKCSNVSQFRVVTSNSLLPHFSPLHSHSVSRWPCDLEIPRPRSSKFHKTYSVIDERASFLPPSLALRFPVCLSFVCPAVCFHCRLWWPFSSQCE